MSLIQTLRSVKIGGVALFDVVATALPFMLIARKLKLALWKAWTFALPAGIMFHRLFGISTPTTDEFFSGKATVKNVVVVLLLVVSIFYPNQVSNQIAVPK